MKRKIFSVLLTLVLVLSFSLMTAVPVSAADITAISVTPLDNTAGATTDYSITMTITTGEPTTVTANFSAFGTTGTDMVLSAVATGTGNYTFTGFVVEPTGVTVDDGNKTIAFTGGTTTAAGVHTIVNAVAGTGLVITNDQDAETQDVTITTTTDSGTYALTIAPDTATQLAFTTQPAGSVSGIALTTQPVVEARDQYGNTDTTYITNVVAATDDLGTLTGTTTKAAVAGVATFADLVYTATADGETFQIDVTSGTLTGATSNGVTCDVEATKLAIVTQPTGAVSSAVLLIQPVINAVDADGTLDTDYVTACAVANETGTGTVDGGPVDPMVLGVATFTDVTVTESPVVHDSYTLRFSSTGLDDVVSDSFKVYDKILDLNDAAWTLISTDDYITSSGDNTSAFEGTVTLKYVYTGSSYLSATVADIEPVEALYVKTTSDDGWVGLNYSTAASPGASIKSLVAGWNLVSSATSDASNADVVLSPLRYVQIGEQEGTGLATLVSQGDYNLNTGDLYLATLTDSDWTTLDTTDLNAFDGYWVYMNAAKSFGVIP